MSDITTNLDELEALFNEQQAGASAAPVVETTPVVETAPTEIPFEQAVVQQAPVQPQVMVQPQVQVQTVPPVVQPQVIPQQVVTSTIQPQVVSQQVAVSPAAALAQNPVVSPVPQMVAPSAVPADFSIDLPEALKASLIESGADIGEIGMKVSRVPIEKYKASTKKIDRIGFITTKVIPVKTHYIENKGSILCFNSKCCELMGNPSVRYLFPIAVYQTDDEGNVCGGKVQLMMLSAGEDLYKTIQTIHKGSAAQGGIDHIDLLVTCADDQYQKITLVQAGPALWRQYSSIANFLAEKWTHDGDKAYMAVARKVDLDSFYKMMEIDTGAEGAGANATIDLQANADLSKFFQ